MPREIDGWREQYEVLARRFPDREMIGILEAAAVMNCDRRTLLKDAEFPARKIGPKYMVPLAQLARYMVRDST